jgi:type IV secretion system protein VirB10
MQNNENAPAPGLDPAAKGTAQDSAQAVPPSSSKARGQFDLLGKRAKEPKPKMLYVAVALIIVLALSFIGGLWWWAMNEFGRSSSGVDETNVTADASLQTPTAEDTVMQKYKEAELQKQQEEENRLRKQKEDQEALERNKATPPAETPPPANNGGNSNNEGAAPPVQTPLQRKLSGGGFTSLKVQDSSSYVAASSGTGESTRPQSGPPGGDVTESLSGGLGGGGGSSRASLGQLSGTGFAPASARLAPPGKYLLSHGTYGRCVLYTEIITENPGLIDCRLADPIYSANGETVIAEAGAKMTGEQRVQVKPGQQTVFTSWTELETSSGVRAPINSLGAGPMGASGTAAWIDYHYKERFGGAVALTLIQDLLTGVVNKTQKSDSGGFTVNNSEQNVESMASKVLDNSINIENTGHILPGTVLTVIFARDIDFSTVFENR